MPNLHFAKLLSFLNGCDLPSTRSIQPPNKAKKSGNLPAVSTSKNAQNEPGLYSVLALHQSPPTGHPICTLSQNGNPATNLVRFSALKQKHRFPSRRSWKSTATQISSSSTLHCSLIPSKPCWAPL